MLKLYQQKHSQKRPGQKKIAKKKTQKKNIARKTKHHKPERVKKTKKRSIERKKNNIIEVSSNGRNFRSKNNRSPHFAIQIASYDKKTKANSEIQSLKNKHFNAYVNKSKVKGKNYYRVRVGPFKSKRDALDLLNEIQNFERYEESYMVKE